MRDDDVRGRHHELDRERPTVRQFCRVEMFGDMSPQRIIVRRVDIQCPRSAPKPVEMTVEHDESPAGQVDGLEYAEAELVSLIQSECDYLPSPPGVPLLLVMPLSLSSVMHVTVRHVTVQRVEQRLCFLHGLVVFGVRVGFDGDAAARADPVQRLVTSPDASRSGSECSDRSRHRR